MSLLIVRPITQSSVKLIMSKQDYVTGMECCEFKYVWTIKNFRQWAGKIIESPSFSSHYADFDDKWILEIYSHFDPDEDGDIYMRVRLQLRSFNNDSQLQTKLTISIDEKNEHTKEYNFSKFLEKIEWIRCINKTNLSNPSQYLPNYHHLKICCTIRMSKKSTNNYSDIIPTFHATRKLNVDWKKLLLSEKSADVTIKVGQKSFRAIKGILGARSPVFSAMFDHEQFKENEKNEVVIEDIEEDVFEEFLHYIYTNESPNVKKMAMELLAIAEKYQVNCLKNICEEVICRTIDFENVASKFVFSDRYNLKKLNQKCFEFMKKNLHDVMANKTFQAYKKKYPEIFVGVLEELLLSADSVNYTIE